MDKEIYHSTCDMASVLWIMETTVRDTQQGENPLPDCPSHCLHVPTSVQPTMLQWGHLSWFATHPSIQWTLELIKG